jgi:hypothetical protein
MMLTSNKENIPNYSESMSQSKTNQLMTLSKDYKRVLEELADSELTNLNLSISPSSLGFSTRRHVVNPCIRR